MKPPKQQGLMATDTPRRNTNTPILNALRSKFTPQTPMSLEERLAAMSDFELQRLVSDAKMLKATMYIKTSVGDFNHGYGSLYKSLYPKIDPDRVALVANFLDAVAPLDFEPQPQPRVKPGANTSYDLGEWRNPYDVDRMISDARELYPPKAEPEQSSFLHKLTQSESSGKAGAEITISNGRRFVGKLQFGQARLDDYMAATGTSFTQDQFAANTAQQDEVAKWHVADLDKAIQALGENAAEYDRDGLRAVAHLGGKGGMRRFVESKGSYNPVDELGTSLQSYYDKFSSNGGGT